MRYLLCLLLAFSFISTSSAQIVISGSVTQEQVLEAQKQKSSAEQLLKRAGGVTAKLEVGEFDEIVRQDSIKGELLWQWTDWDKRVVTFNDCAAIIRHDVAAGEALVIHMKRAGDDKVKTHKFPARDKPWQWVEAVADGSVTLAVSANGEVGKMPVVVSNVVFTVGNPTPKPVDPVDPPIITPVTGFRVLFIYEKDQKLTQEQANILASTKIVDYMDKKTTKDELGNNGWRKWDKDVVISKKESKVFQDLWAAVKPKIGALPQIGIVRDNKVDLFAMPDTEAKTLEFLQSFGGK